MTKVILDLNDPINIFRNKFNRLSNSFGDLNQLYSGDSDIVTAFNNTDSNVTSFGIRLDQLETPLDSDAVIRIVNNDVFPITDSDDIGSLVISTNKLGNLAITNEKIADSAISISKLFTVESLIIYDSTGSAVKTIYSPGA